MSETKEVPTVDNLHGHYISLAMIMYGGGFMKHLGEALAVADAHNYRLIVATWRLQINHCIEIWWRRNGCQMNQSDIRKDLG